MMIGEGLRVPSKGELQPLLGAGVAVNDGGGGHPSFNYFTPTIHVPLRQSKHPICYMVKKLQR
jgi:hypothetical protein